MLKTYKARLKNDRLEWLETPPLSTPNEEPVEVHVTLLSDQSTAPVAPDKPAKSGAKMVEALEKLASIGGLADIIPDPMTWQRETRKDRPLLGRE